MSNFSNLGFKITTQEEFYQLLEYVHQLSKQIKVKEGKYSVFTDRSGAQLYLQFNSNDEFIGVNPHFEGKSKFKVYITDKITNEESGFDGAMKGWADPDDTHDEPSGAYPLVFDIPDFKIISSLKVPKIVAIQLIAFAQEINFYDSEKDFHRSQTKDLKIASKSFIPSGLFSLYEKVEKSPPEAEGILSGLIKDFELKKNEVTSENFYWLLVDTLGGEVDVVADTGFFDNPPVKNGIIHGQFYLTGRFLS